MKCVVIFGGCGFIGSFVAKYFLDKLLFDKIILIDIEPISSKNSFFRRKLIESDSRIDFICADVRRNLKKLSYLENITLVLNLAAIHREPGHDAREYFETNTLGAKNVCEFAEFVGCNNIIFTSSISPYGVSEEIKDEGTLPVPITAYGSSKLIAEKIHQIWQAKDKNNRRLVIVRPGVVFGPGEGGNVSRLIKAVLKRYFFFTGNQDTRKAGIYVKELCNAMWWGFERQEITGDKVSLFNLSMNPGPSIAEYVNVVCKVANVKRFVPSIPYWFLLSSSYCMDFLAKFLRIKHPFSPIRIRKLVLSNNILPTYLLENNYEFLYTLESAFSDWKESCPEEWH
jgi:nucleoside-diphosphate-sugar epimerase